MLIPIYRNTTIQKCPFRLKTFRGCVTSGKRWVFFVYNVENPEDGRGKSIHWLETIPLGERHNPTVNLELILGILRDWVSLNLVTPSPCLTFYRVRLNTAMRVTYGFLSTQCDLLFLAPQIFPVFFMSIHNSLH
jgi:hypothetical protein